MISAPPETLTLDRVGTPIGMALVVTDEAGVLRAFNWTDYEDQMSAWIARRYPKAVLGEGRGPLQAPLRGGRRQDHGQHGNAARRGLRRNPGASAPPPEPGLTRWISDLSCFSP